MKWEFCNNSESRELLTRDKNGKIVASVFIDDEGITALSNNGKRTLVKTFPTETNLLDVENHIKQDLGIQ